MTPALARLAGGVGRDLPLRIGGDPVNVRVAAVVDRIPGTRGDAVLADLGAITNAVDTAAPGGAQRLGALARGRARGAGPGRRRVVAAPVRRPREAVARGARGGRPPRSARPRDAPRARRVRTRGPRARGCRARARDPRRPTRRPRRAHRPRGAGRDARRAAPLVAARAALVGVVGCRGGALAGVVLASRRHAGRLGHRRADAPEPPLATTVDALSLALGTAAFAVAVVALVVVDDPPRVRRPARPGPDREARDERARRPARRVRRPSLRGRRRCRTPWADARRRTGRDLRRARPERRGQVDARPCRRRSRASVGRARARGRGRRRRRVGVRRRTPPRPRRRVRRPALLARALRRPDRAGARRPPARRSAARRGPTGTAARDELLERVGLLDRATARPRELSGGEQQRIALCAALAHRPRCSSRTSRPASSTLTAAGVLELLGELARDEGATALVVSHDPRVRGDRRPRRPHPRRPGRARSECEAATRS